MVRFEVAVKVPPPAATLPVMGFVLKFAVAPAGKPDAERLAVPGPLNVVVVRLFAVVPPAATVCEFVPTVTAVTAHGFTISVWVVVVAELDCGLVSVAVTVNV
jgi:hypothetical protein